MSTVLITNGHVVDAASNSDHVRDVCIADGVIVDSLPGPPDETIDASGMLVLPGLVDLHVRFGEPGYEEDETIETGTAAAIAGGVTTVGCLPETKPVIDSQATVEFVALQAERAGNCRVHPIGSVTKGRKGEELAEIGQLVAGGAKALSDGRDPIGNAEVMRRALQYASMFQLTILHRPEVPELIAGGVMHEGLVSTINGLPGMPASAEHIMVRRDIALAERTSGRVHLMGVSTEISVGEIRQARQRGVNVTADVTPYHLLFTEEQLRDFNVNYTIDPPLRTEADRLALIEGIKDGSITVISSDHRPIAPEKKDVELDQSPFGIVGIETFLSLCVKTLVEPGHCSWADLTRLVCHTPAVLLNMAHEVGSLSPGCKGDVAIVDPSTSWTVNPQQFRSKSRNSPLAGMTLPTRIVRTIVGGETKFQAN